jgi:hypothetical protein
MAIPLQLLPILEYHSHTQDKHNIDADDAESGREDDVEVAVCKGREGADAAALLGGDERVGAGAVLDEGRRGGVVVAAAVEL